jgi:hypothetical protein
MECQACQKEFREGDTVFLVTRGPYNEEDDQAIEVEEVGRYCEECFPPLP